LVHINGKKVFMTSDSGAGVSLIKEEVVGSCKRIPNDKYNLVNLDNKIILDVGIAIVPLKIGSLEIEHEFMIVKEAPTEILLGEGVFQQFGFNINYDKECLYSKYRRNFIHKKPEENEHAKNCKKNCRNICSRKYNGGIENIKENKNPRKVRNLGRN